MESKLAAEVFTTVFGSQITHQMIRNRYTDKMGTVCPHNKPKFAAEGRVAYGYL